MNPTPSDIYKCECGVPLDYDADTDTPLDLVCEYCPRAYAVDLSDGTLVSLAKWQQRAVEAERDRDELRLSLLVERFDQAGALPGWDVDGGPAFRLDHHPIRGYVFRAQTHPPGEPWEWQRFEGGALVAFGYAAGPREAMRAAMEGA